MEDSADGKPKKSGARHCCICNQKRAALKRPKTLEQVIPPTRIHLTCVCWFGLFCNRNCWLLMKICRECFYEVFEEEIHAVIVENQLFKPGERIAIGASGGKGTSYCAN